MYVGDDQFAEDPSVNRLQELVAEMLGKATADSDGLPWAAGGVRRRPGSAVLMVLRNYPGCQRRSEFAASGTRLLTPDRQRTLADEPENTRSPTR